MCLKGQCQEIFDHFFCLKDPTWAPYEQAKTVWRNLSFSRRYSIAKVENRDTLFFFRYGDFNLFKLLLLHRVPVTIFLADCSFKICGKPSPCPRSRWRRQHRVRVDKDYADIMSAKSTTTRLCGQAIFENIKLHFLLLFSLVFFYLFQSKKIKKNKLG